MAGPADADAGHPVPLLLLKTRSAPADAYYDFFSAPGDFRFEPVFVPVLEHRHRQDALDQIRRDITLGTKYGAIIFTSQRAVEAFTQVVEDIRRDPSSSLEELLPQHLPLYVVGPATARGLRALRLPCPILGEDTGTGEVLSSFILDHYNKLHKGPKKPPLLFLVGDKRRDIIPKTLESDGLAPELRCQVDEVVVYETGEMLSFRDNFSSIWRKNVEDGKSRQWVVVFSPTGCKAMLESLGLLDEQSGRLRPGAGQHNNVFVATIGPTTRDYLLNEFDFSPHVCADKPCPEGIARGINAFAKAWEQQDGSSQYIE